MKTAKIEAVRGEVPKNRQELNSSDLTVHKALGNNKRAKILEMICSSAQPLSAEDIADVLKIHVNTVRSHILILFEAGLIDQNVIESNRPGRPSIKYSSGERETELNGGYGFLTSVLVGELATKSFGKDFAMNAGKQWGKYFTPQIKPGKVVDISEGIEILKGLLIKLGFEPTMEGLQKPKEKKLDSVKALEETRAVEIANWAETGSRHSIGIDNTDRVIHLNRCPFRQAAQEHGDIVCGIHLGIVNGVFENLGLSSVNVKLSPFTGPMECTLKLTENLAMASQTHVLPAAEPLTELNLDPGTENRLNAKKQFDQRKNRRKRRIIKMEPQILDVRPILAKGEEPFVLIMETVDNLGENQDLIVYAPFDPIPLEGVLTEKGFDFEANPLGDGDFQVRFFRP